MSQVCLGVDLESLAGELLKAIAAELIQGCTEVARELLGRVAWERCLGVARGSAAGVGPGLLGSWSRVARELLGSCSGELLRSCSGVELGLLRSCSVVARGTCSGELLGSCSEDLLGR